MCPVFQESPEICTVTYVLPVVKSVCVVSCESGVRLVESGEVSAERDSDWVIANTVNH